MPCQRFYDASFQGEAKNIPVRLVQATEVVRGHIFAQLGMPLQLKQCCKSCSIEGLQNFHPITQITTLHTKQELRKGDPLSVNYETASRKTEKKD